MPNSKTPIDYCESKQFNATSVNIFLEKLHPYLYENNDITEICINRPNEVFYEKKGIWHTEKLDADLHYLTSFATATAKYNNQDIGDTRPILSAELPKGERIQFVMSPACERHTLSITIRKPSLVTRTMDEYSASGFFKHIHPITDTISAQDQHLLSLKTQGNYEDFLRQAVIDEKVIVIAGETGSGKTTFMKSLIQSIESSQRIITIEDVHELFLPNHPNHVHLFYPSEAKEEENAPVTSAVLLKSCLRMKPNRILLAELRGGETFDFLNVCSSGHGGSITSCHAGSCAMTFERLALMVMQNRQGRQLPYDVIKRLLYQVIDVVVHVHVDSIHGRHITEIWFDPQKKLTAN